MRILIISKNMPPTICGIADHSVMLAKALSAMGHQVLFLSANGSAGANHHVVENFWDIESLHKILKVIDTLNVDHIVLQYTPLMYAINGKNPNFQFADFWSVCSRKWDSSLILHETYFKAWWHPTSIIRGTFEKHLMKLMVRYSKNVFTASQPLYEEITRWKGNTRGNLLPIGSNFDVNPIDKKNMRLIKGVDGKDIVLNLFGGGLNVRKLSYFIDKVDTIMFKNKIKVQWLLLGGLQKEWFKFKSSTICPGYLTNSEISTWLQMSDVFLMPHISGLSAKRGTLIAAMQHSLPVVGTKGPMTDQFWTDVPGVTLCPLSSADKFAQSVLKIAISAQLRNDMGRSNHDYYLSYFTWHDIASKFLDCVQK